MLSASSAVLSEAFRAFPIDSRCARLPGVFSLPPPQLAAEAGLLFRVRCWNQYGQEGGLLAGRGDQGNQRGLREYNINEAVWALRFYFSH